MTVADKDGKRGLGRPATEFITPILDTFGNVISRW